MSSATKTSAPTATSAPSALAAELQNSLPQFCGTESYYKHWSGKLMHTDGVEYLAEKAGAYWMVDLVASHQSKRISKLPFRIWSLKVDRTRNPMAVAECREDIGEPVIVRQKIEYTDFPLDAIELWLCDGVLMLPSEY